MDEENQVEDSTEMEDFEKFNLERAKLEDYLEAHSGSTRDEIIRGIGWSPEKVDILLDLLILWEVAIPTPQSTGEMRYQYQSFFVVLGRRMEERGRLSAPTPENTTDHFKLLREKGLL